jgi:hypothetical protein
MANANEKISAQEKVNAVVAQATEKIIGIIESGDFGAWQKSWADTGCPTNAVTNK